MILATIPGCPLIGKRRELKRALEGTTAGSRSGPASQGQPEARTAAAVAGQRGRDLL
jgi:hypothetical protein